MTKRKLYRYLGRNGILTTRILIEGAYNIPMLELKADEGKILTNGEKYVYLVVIEEGDLPLWKEVADKNK